MTTYTVIAYWPNGVDTCRGCVMGTSDSDFEYRSFQCADDAAGFWAAKRLEDKSQKAREYSSLETTLLVDGLDSSDWWQVQGDAPESPHEEVERLADEKLKELLAAKAEAARVAAEVAERKAQAESERRRQLQEKHELAEFQRLQAKFAGTTAAKEAPRG